MPKLPWFKCIAVHVGTFVSWKLFQKWLLYNPPLGSLLYMASPYLTMSHLYRHYLCVCAQLKVCADTWSKNLVWTFCHLKGISSESGNLQKMKGIPCKIKHLFQIIRSCYQQYSLIFSIFQEFPIFFEQKRSIMLYIIPKYAYISFCLIGMWFTTSWYEFPIPWM